MRRRCCPRGRRARRSRPTPAAPPSATSASASRNAVRSPGSVQTVQHSSNWSTTSRMRSAPPRPSRDRDSRSATRSGPVAAAPDSAALVSSRIGCSPGRSTILHPTRAPRQCAGSQRRQQPCPQQRRLARTGGPDQQQGPIHRDPRHQLGGEPLPPGEPRRRRPRRRRPAHATGTTSGSATGAGCSAVHSSTSSARASRSAECAAADPLPTCARCATRAETWSRAQAIASRWTAAAFPRTRHAPAQRLLTTPLVDPAAGMPGEHLPHLLHRQGADPELRVEHHPRGGLAGDHDCSSRGPGSGTGADGLARRSITRSTNPSAGCPPTTTLAPSVWASQPGRWPTATGLSPARPG